MNVTITIKDEDGTETTHETSWRAGAEPGVLVIMAKQRADGAVAVDDFEPGEINSHPDTTRENGGRIELFYDANK
jgi:hypothetical protein